MTSDADMSPGDPVLAVRQYIDAFNKGDAEGYTSVATCSNLTTFSTSC
jgi:hypothetical protein